MRGGGIIGAIVLVWLLIGVFAAWQRRLLQGERHNAHSGIDRHDSDCRAVELQGCQSGGQGLSTATQVNVPAA